MGPFPELGDRPHALDAKCGHLCTAKEAEEPEPGPKRGTPTAPWHRLTAPPPAASGTPPRESQQTHLVPPCDSAGAVLLEPRCSLSCLAQVVSSPVRPGHDGSGQASPSPHVPGRSASPLLSIPSASAW